MRIAVFDLGTNTFHLLVADVGGGIVRAVFRSRRSVKLGQGGIHQKSIEPIPYKRGLKAMEAYADVIRKYRPDKVRAFATSAIRDASNGKEFVRQIFRKTGIRVDIISGAVEAELIYNGVRQCVPPGNGIDLIMDIGGGSTEFILAGRKGVIWKRSFDSGVSRLLEMFRPSDPMGVKDVRRLHAFLETAWAPLHAALGKYPVQRLIGSSGSFDSLAAIIGWRYHGRNPLQHARHYSFDLGEYKKLDQVLRASTMRQRMQMKGLVRMRVDTIVLASLCTRYVLEKFKPKEMILSRYALKEGALWKESKTKKE